MKTVIVKIFFNNSHFAENARKVADAMKASNQYAVYVFEIPTNHDNDVFIEVIN